MNVKQHLKNPDSKYLLNPDAILEGRFYTVPRKGCSQLLVAGVTFIIFIFHAITRKYFNVFLLNFTSDRSYHIKNYQQYYEPH